MTTRNVLIQVASQQQNKMMVCRETLSSHAEGGYIEIWGYVKPDQFTKIRTNGRTKSMKLRDALMDYVKSDAFDWADDDIHGVHRIGYDIKKTRHPVDGTAGFLLRIGIME